MKPHLFTILFFTGAVPLDQPVPYKYYLIQQSNTWNNAQDYCRVNHTDLAIVRNNEDMVQLQNEAQRKQFISTAWIGLYNDINSWHWSMGNESLGSTRLWGAPQPDNWHGNQCCGAINSGGWDDSECYNSIPFVCFDDTKTGNQRYIYITTNKAWYEAQAYCRSLYTDLASARDATENSVISGLISNWAWFGLIRDSWKWTDQTKFSSISWMSGKPDNAQMNENCGYLENGQVADAQCSDIRPFFCYAEITGKQQIMRMEVRSNKDANDPALMDAIMEKIKQKLNEHWLAENIKVKWRWQLDGKVFHKKNTRD